jgi:hypothetical protein
MVEKSLVKDVALSVDGVGAADVEVVVEELELLHAAATRPTTNTSDSAAIRLKLRFRIIALLGVWWMCACARAGVKASERRVSTASNPARNLPGAVYDRCVATRPTLPLAFADVFPGPGAAHKIGTAVPQLSPPGCHALAIRSFM